jgi:hypothetical protein
LTTRMDEARARAEASFRKEERAKDGAMAMTEYQANIQLVREKKPKYCAHFDWQKRRPSAAANKSI